MPRSIFLDTDIGTDIDDAYALLMAAVSPEVELVGVSTVNNDTVLRARIARKLLNLLGCRHIPVVAGRGQAITPGVTIGWAGHEGEGIDLAESEILYEPLPDLFARLASDHMGVTLVTIGAMTNAAWLIEALGPERRGLIREIVAMASTFEGYNTPAREHNVACDPDAFRRVLESGVPVTLIGLNVTQRTSMTGAQLEQLEAIGGPLAGALSGVHRVWFRQIGRHGSPMHDALAVAAVFRPQLVSTVEVVPANPTPGLREEGAVGYYPAEPGRVTQIRIATDLDIEGFQALFWERTLQAVRLSKERNGWGGS